ncbi:MAG: hypothetical protein RL559_16 [Pseudomonadota bacterium]
MVFRGYDREDGLWDIEAELTDIKPYTFQVPNERPFPADQPIHGLSIRLTIDDEMQIHAVAVAMDHIPHPECSQVPPNMQALVGCRLGRGWRKTIDEKVGGSAGCTHLREMLFNMATAAFQTLPSGQWHRRALRGEPHPAITEPPFHLGQCMTWDLSSPTVARAYPMFYRPKAKTEASASGDN